MLPYRFVVTPDVHYRATRAVQRRSIARKVVECVLVLLPLGMVAVAVATGWPLSDAILTKLNRPGFTGELSS
jgi:hypothetical protein